MSLCGPSERERSHVYLHGSIGMRAVDVASHTFRSPLDRESARSFERLSSPIPCRSLGRRAVDRASHTFRSPPDRESARSFQKASFLIPCRTFRNGAVDRPVDVFRGPV